MITKQMWQQALDVQDASNLSGVAHSFDKIIDEVWAEARELGKGTDDVNTHPLVRLWGDKLAHLAGLQQSFGEAMYDAYAEAYRQTLHVTQS